MNLAMNLFLQYILWVTFLWDIFNLNISVASSYCHFLFIIHFETLYIFYDYFHDDLGSRLSPMIHSRDNEKYQCSIFDTVLFTYRAFHD